MQPLLLGDVRIDRLVDDPGQDFAWNMLFPDATEAAIRAAQAVLPPGCIAADTLALTLNFNSYLVRAGGRNILVDTCVGNHKNRPNRPGWHQRDGDFLARLGTLGVSPEQVDFVLCTHLHADHVGWNTVLRNGRWVPTFPNARYVMARPEYDHWLAETAKLPPGGLLHGSFDDSVLPVVRDGQALFVETNHVLSPQICLCPAPGHTPGNLVVQVEGTGGRAVVSGDVIHHPVQLRHPDWSTRFCTDPVQSRVTRRAFIEDHAVSGVPILPAHFISPSAGRILRDGDAYRFVFLE